MGRPEGAPPEDGAAGEDGIDGAGERTEYMHPLSSATHLRIPVQDERGSAAGSPRGPSEAPFAMSRGGSPGPGSPGGFSASGSQSPGMSPRDLTGKRRARQLDKQFQTLVRRSSIKARTSEVGVASEELTAPTKARVSMELSVSPLTSTPGRLSLSRALSQRVLDMGNVEDIERAVQADAENMSNLDSARGPGSPPNLGSVHGSSVHRRPSLFRQTSLQLAGSLFGPDRSEAWKLFMIRVFGMPAMYANKYKFMTVDEADPSLDKPISRWYEVVIHPLSSFRKWWDLLIIVFILWNIVVQLVKIAFYWHDPLLAHGGLGFLVLNIVIDFFFMADLILNFNTGYFQDLDQVLVMDRRRIAWTYLKGWFFIDLVSSIPFDLILISATSNGSSTAGRLPKLLRVLKITRLLRLLRVTKMARYLTKYNFFSSLSTFVSRILSHVAVILLYNHWNACIQFLIPSMLGFPDLSWPVRSGIVYKSVFEQYTWSLFRALAQMFSIGYGSPGEAVLTVPEAWNLIVSFTLGALIWVLMTGMIVSLLVQMNGLDSEYRRQLAVLNKYMLMRNLPLSLRARIRENYEFKWAAGKFMKEQDVMDMLPTALRNEVALHNARDIVGSVPFFQNADPGFVNAIVTKLEPEVYLPGDRIIKMGDLGEDMYFIKMGLVQVSIRGRPVSVLGTGSYFGEIALLKSAPRAADIDALEPCELFKLGRADFEDMMRMFPGSRAYMDRIADARLAVLREADPLKGANSQRSQHSLLSAMIKAAPKVSDGPGPSEEVARAGAGTALLDAVAAGRRDVGRWSLDEGHAALKQIEHLEQLVPDICKEFRRAAGPGSAESSVHDGAAMDERERDAFLNMLSDMKKRVMELAAIPSGRPGQPGVAPMPGLTSANSYYSQVFGRSSQKKSAWKEG